MQTIKLSEFDVDVKTKFTWGDYETLRAILYSGFTTEISKDGQKKNSFDPETNVKSKFKTIELAILKIRKPKEDGTFEEIKFSNDWVYNLTKEDGDLLFDAIDELSKKKDNSQTTSDSK